MCFSCGILCLHQLPIQTYNAYIEASQVGFLFACKDLEGSRLADTIGAYKTKDLSRPRGGQAVELEGVGTVPMGGVFLQVTW